MTTSRRTTADLIEELAAEAASGRFKEVWLAVGFKKSTE